MARPGQGEVSVGGDVHGSRGGCVVRKGSHMTRVNSGWFITSWAVCGLLWAPILSAAEDGGARTTPIVPLVDVALDEADHLSGQVLDREGQPIVNSSVDVAQHGQRFARVMTDERGAFEVRLRRGGVYQLLTADGVTGVRVWTRASAPPSCARRVVIVQGDVQRGQSGRFPPAGLSPWVIAGVVAIAVGIPVAIQNHRSDRGDGS